MKNIFTYINPKKEFDENNGKLVKVQIDNSLELGWKTEDIILVTNFDYEYNGIKALVVSDDAYCDYSPISTKVNVVLRLFELGIIKDELYWVHDLDAFQLVKIPELEINLEGKDMALCDYGRLPKWAGGSIFFNKNSKDIFEKIKIIMYEREAVDENALTYLTTNDEELKKRIKKNNISYNFLPNNLRSCYKIAIKPIRVAHFHPFGGKIKLEIENMLDFYKGKNKLNVSLIPERLVKILNKHEIY